MSSSKIDRLKEVGRDQIQFAIMSRRGIGQHDYLTTRTFGAFALGRRYATQREAVLAFAQAARRELVEWAETPKPRGYHPDSIVTQFVTINVWTLRGFGLGKYWATGKGFWREWCRLGGETRINMLLIIARFDEDNSGDIDDKEIEDFHKFGEALVSNAVSAYLSIATVFALFIVATHQNVIGRPVTWIVPGSFSEQFGDHVGSPLLLIAFTLNALLEFMCVAMLFTCIAMRSLLLNVLTTLEKRIALLVSSNSLQITITLSVYCMYLLVALCLTGGVVGQPGIGFVLIGLVPVFLLLIMNRIVSLYIECIMSQHDEAVELISGSAKEMLGASQTEEAQYQSGTRLAGNVFEPDGSSFNVATRFVSDDASAAPAPDTSLLVTQQSDTGASGEAQNGGIDGLTLEAEFTM